MSKTLLMLEQAGHTFDGVRWLFRDISWELNSGEIMALLGPTGRGKTTLLRCLIGLEKLSKGSASTMTPPAFVPQSHAPVFSYSVLAMVVMGRVRNISVMSAPSTKDLELAHQALDRVGLGHLAHRDFPTLSGGERQLVLLARAIVGDTKLLVLDEPAASLDLGHQALLLSLLRELADEGWGAVMTTHHPDHAFAIADKATLLYGDDKALIGCPDEVMDSQTISELYGVEAHVLSYGGPNNPGKATATRYSRPTEKSSHVLPER